MKFFKSTFLILPLLLGLVTAVAAQEPTADGVCPIAKTVGSYDAFKSIPVLDNGRVKPLDTFARSTLLQFSGKQTFQKKPAIEWLARVLFDPGKSLQYEIFLINNPQIVESLGIEVAEGRRYSYSELEAKYPELRKLAEAAERIESKDRDIVEAELIRVHNNLRLFSSLTLTFSFVLPHPDFMIQDAELKQRMGLPAGQEVFSYYDVASNANVLHELVRPLESLPQDQWTAGQQEIVRLAASLLQWSMIYQNLPVHIVPPYDPKVESWHSPWDALPIALKLKSGRQELQLLKEMLVHYWDGRDLEFDLAVKNFVESARSRSGSGYEEAMKRNQIELFYNNSNLFLYAKILYFLTFLLFSMSLMIDRPLLRNIGWTVLWIAVIAHTVALGMRIMILQRPPVSNLYETFIFVGLISAMCGMVIEKVMKNWLGIIVASISGYAFLSIAAKFAVEGDTLQMLVAVLNSNFWLATHVTTITVGYAGTCVAGIVGHVYMLQAIFKTNDKKLLRSTYNVLLGTLGFGLTFSFLGTNLGGIWADQSWGRFWGWDPKENGALMIILWTAIIFHAKIGRMISPLGVAVGSILGIIVVMWAWFGVNLLSVGLHSYGFTSGLATNLAIYCLCQMLFLCVTYPLARSRMNKK